MSHSDFPQSDLIHLSKNGVSPLVDCKHEVMVELFVLPGERTNFIGQGSGTFTRSFREAALQSSALSVSLGAISPLGALFPACKSDASPNETFVYRLEVPEVTADSSSSDNFANNT